MSEYNVRLENISDEEEEFELAGDNIAQIEAMDVDNYIKSEK